MKLKTVGVSRKVLADLLTSVIAFALAFYGFELDPTASALLAKGIGFVAGVLAPANPVEVRGEAGQSAVEVMCVLTLIGVVLLLAGVRL